MAFTIFFISFFEYTVVEDVIGNKLISYNRKDTMTKAIDSHILK